MTTHLVTFATDNMMRSAKLCIESAKQQGVSGKLSGGDAALIYPQSTLWKTDFYRSNKELLDKPRGCGYFAWKPFVISEEMGGLSDGDILIYSDAGVEFIDNVFHIIDRMDQDIFLFGNNWEHAHWCKRDVVDAIIPRDYGNPVLGGQLDHELAWCIFGKQVQASVIFFRVSDYTRAFVKEWLDWCLFEGGRLIDDSPSRLPNHPEFREHRHDQAILTTLSYREGLRLHWWPAVYNRFVPGGPVFTYEKGEYQDDYPPLFHHHRLRDDQWPQHISLKPAETSRDIAYHTME